MVENESEIDLQFTYLVTIDSNVHNTIGNI